MVAEDIIWAKQSTLEKGSDSVFDGGRLSTQEMELVHEQPEVMHRLSGMHTR